MRTKATSEALKPNLPKGYVPPKMPRRPVNGNAFAIMGAVGACLKKAGHGDLVEQYTKEAMSGDYDHLLRVTMAYVDLEPAVRAEAYEREDED